MKAGNVKRGSRVRAGNDPLARLELVAEVSQPIREVWAALAPDPTIAQASPDDESDSAKAEPDLRDKSKQIGPYKLLQQIGEGGMGTVEEFFESLVTEGCANSSRWGCLIVNTGIENAELKRPALQAASDDYWSTLAQHFEAALCRSIEKGEIDRTLDAGEASQGLVTAVMGIQTMNRVSGTHDAGAPLVNMVRDLIKSWRT